MWLIFSLLSLRAQPPSCGILCRCAEHFASLYGLSPARLIVIEPKGRAPKINLSLGQTDWQPSGKQARLESPGDGPAELLLFEFKTGPVDAQEGKPKTHDHPRE